MSGESMLPEQSSKSEHPARGLFRCGLETRGALETSFCGKEFRSDGEDDKHKAPSNVVTWRSDQRCVVCGGSSGTFLGPRTQGEANLGLGGLTLEDLCLVVLLNV